MRRAISASCADLRTRDAAPISLAASPFGVPPEPCPSHPLRDAAPAAPGACHPPIAPRCIRLSSFLFPPALCPLSFCPIPLTSAPPLLVPFPALRTPPSLATFSPFRRPRPARHAARRRVLRLGLCFPAPHRGAPIAISSPTSVFKDHRRKAHLSPLASTRRRASPLPATPTFDARRARRHPNKTSRLPSDRLTAADSFLPDSRRPQPILPPPDSSQQPSPLSSRALAPLDPARSRPALPPSSSARVDRNAPGRSPLLCHFPADPFVPCLHPPSPRQPGLRTPFAFAWHGRLDARGPLLLPFFSPSFSRRSRLRRPHRPLTIGPSSARAETPPPSASSSPLAGPTPLRLPSVRAPPASVSFDRSIAALFLSALHRPAPRAPPPPSCSPPLASCARTAAQADAPLLHRHSPFPTRGQTPKGADDPRA